MIQAWIDQGAEWPHGTRRWRHAAPLQPCRVEVGDGLFRLLHYRVGELMFPLKAAAEGIATDEAALFKGGRRVAWSGNRNLQFRDHGQDQNGRLRQNATMLIGSGLW